MEIQQVVEEISDATKKNHEFYKIDEGNNYFGYMAELYLLNPNWIKGTDKTYGSGASKFIGEALKFYSENSKS